MCGTIWCPAHQLAPAEWQTLGRDGGGGFWALISHDGIPRLSPTLKARHVSADETDGDLADSFGPDRR
jgi:hypothetical protein